MLIKIIALFLTLLLGFIGTFIVRIAIVKDNFSKAMLPTFMHFLLNLAVIIPVIGIVIAFAGSLYFAYRNFMLAK